MIKQVSVFLENKEGRLLHVLQILNDNQINLRSLTVAETSDYGVLRLILDKPKEGVQKLKEAGFIVKETNVLAVEVEDKAGAMLCVVKELSSNNLAVEYAYSCLPVHEKKVIIIIRVNDTEHAKVVLQESNCANLLNIEELM